jgi:hypothetical protein
MKKFSFFALLITLFNCLPFISSGQGFGETWARTGGSTGNEAGTGIVADQQGGIYVTGHFTSQQFTLGAHTLFNAGGTDVFLAKYDTSGNAIWLKRLGSSGEDVSSKPVYSVDNSIYLKATFPGAVTIGATNLAAGDYLLKFNLQGDLIWAKSGIPGTVNGTDAHGNVYVFGGVGYSKYDRDGNFLFRREVTSTVNSYSPPLMSVDRNNNTHLIFHSPNSTRLETTPAHSGIYLLSNLSHIWYDSSGTLLGAESISGNIRERMVNFTARTVTDYSHFNSWSNLTGRFTHLWVNKGQNISVSHFTTCPITTTTNVEYDETGGSYFAGEYTHESIACVAGPAFFPSSTGKDIFMLRVGSEQVKVSTAGNGNTNETPFGIAVEPLSKSLFVTGSWSKVLDTSRFYFGNSILNHAGAVGNNDFLLLRLKIQTVALRANAGFDRTLCAGGSATIGENASGGSGGYSYQWTPSTGLSSATIAKPVARPDETTVYILRVTDAAGTVSRDTVKVTIDSNLYKPTISVLSGTLPLCEGAMVTLGSSTATSYQWTPATTGPSNTSTIAVTAAGTYSVRAVSAEGCIGTSLPFVVTTTPSPLAPTISVNGATVICGSGSRTLTAESSQTITQYEWSNSATTSSINVINAGTYSVRIKTSGNGCWSPYASINITSAPAVSGTVSASGPVTFCEGDSVQLNMATSANNSVSWSTGQTGNSIWVKQSGNYSAQVVSPAGCTATTNAVAVTVNSKPSKPSIQTSGPASFCAGGSITLSAQVPPNSFGVSWSTGQTSLSIQATTSGIYRVHQVSNTGCRSDADSIEVIVHPLPTGNVVPAGPVSFCEGDSIRLSVITAPGNTAVWNNGVNGNSIWAKNAGNYFVNLSSNGCNAVTNTVVVSVQPRPSPSIQQSQNILTVIPAMASYQWFLNGTAIPGATAQSLTMSSGGDYSVEVTAANGCRSTASLSAVIRSLTQVIDYQVYPNPVSSNINIIYTLKEAGQVSISLLDVNGQVVRTVISGQQQTPGNYQYSIPDATLRFQKGIYLVKIQVGNKIYTQKIVL